MMRTGAGTARPAPRRRGSTLLELTVVVAMTGILASMAVPSFRRAVEQARVDQAAATLRTIWSAQRFYRLDHGAYADSLAALQQAGLLDAAPDTAAFRFALDEGGLPARAVRLGGSAWAGELSIGADGVVAGSVVGDGHELVPAFRFEAGS